MRSDLHTYLQAERLWGRCLDQIGPALKGLPVPVLLVADTDIGPPLLWCSKDKSNVSVEVSWIRA